MTSKPGFGQNIVDQVAQLDAAALEEYMIEVALGNKPGVSTVIIRGHNTDIDAGQEEDVWEGGGDLAYLATAGRMNISSTDANDTAAGSGLQDVFVFGVGDNGSALMEPIVLNGLANVLTVNSYLRVNILIGGGAGSSGWNEGVITAIAQSAASVQCTIDITESLSQNSQYTVVLG